MYGPVGNAGAAETLVEDGGTTLLLTTAGLTVAELAAAGLTAAELATAELATAELAITEDDAGAEAASLAKMRAQMHEVMLIMLA